MFERREAAFFLPLGAQEEEMYILQISRHSPESCMLFNEQSRNMTVKLLKGMEKLLPKHGIKLLSSWNDMAAHEIFNIYEAPNMESFMELLKEPEMVAWLNSHRVQNRVVLSLEQAKPMLGL